MAEMGDATAEQKLRTKLVTLETNVIIGLITIPVAMAVHQKLDSVMMSVLLLALGVTGAGVSAFVESAINRGNWRTCAGDMLVAMGAFTLGGGFPSAIGRLIDEQVVRAVVTVILSGLVIYGTLYWFEDSVDAPNVRRPRRFQISKTWITALIMGAGAIMVGLSAMVELNK